MGVSNVNTANKASLVKLALTRKAGQAKETFKPDYLRMTGSIFNAPGAKETQATSQERTNLAELNAQKSIQNLKPAGTGGASTAALDEDNFKDIDDVSSGKKAVSTGKSATNKVKSYTSQTEKDATEAQETSQKAVQLGKALEKDDKTFVKKLQSDQKAFDNENKKIQKLTQEAEETQKEIDDAQHELEGLLATNAFRMKSGGAASSSGNTARINELQTLIGSKVSMLQNNGKVIYSLQRNQKRTLSRMNRTNRQYVQVQNKTQKNIQAQQNSTSKLIDVTNKIEQYSALAQAGGQAINLAGVGLVALGKAMSGTGFGVSVGSALIAVGKVMIKVGRVLELVGQYGQAAANVTKTAAYAAEGNLVGAMTSCMMAVQSGAAAVKSTKEIGNTFKSIDAQANAAKQNIAAKAEAREYVKGHAEEVQASGMSEKQFRKGLTQEYRQQLAENGTTGKLKDMRAGLNSVDAASQVVKTFEEAQSLARKDFGITDDNSNYSTTSNRNISMAKLDRRTNRNFRNAVADMRGNVETTLAKNNSNYKSRNIGDIASNLSSSLMNVGMVFMQNQAMKEMSGNARGRQIPQYQMDARTQRIIQRNAMYVRHASYV